MKLGVLRSTSSCVEWKGCGMVWMGMPHLVLRNTLCHVCSRGGLFQFEQQKPCTTLWHPADKITTDTISRLTIQDAITSLHKKTWPWWNASKRVITWGISVEYNLVSCVSVIDCLPWGVTVTDRALAIRQASLLSLVMRTSILRQEENDVPELTMTYNDYK